MTNITNCKHYVTIILWVHVANAVIAMNESLRIAGILEYFDIK